eukprot:m.721100 g.721100  ORF g.721100 m.721100 type:complete len:130 (-) comp58818_c0_seq49:302-691(-)
MDPLESVDIELAHKGAVVLVGEPAWGDFLSEARWICNEEAFSIFRPTNAELITSRAGFLVTQKFEQAMAEGHGPALARLHTCAECTEPRAADRVRVRCSVCPACAQQLEGFLSLPFERPCSSRRINPAA